MRRRRSLAVVVVLCLVAAGALWYRARVHRADRLGPGSLGRYSLIYAGCGYRVSTGEPNCIVRRPLGERQETTVVREKPAYLIYPSSLRVVGAELVYDIYPRPKPVAQRAYRYGSVTPGMMAPGAFMGVFLAPRPGSSKPAPGETRRPLPRAPFGRGSTVLRAVRVSGGTPHTLTGEAAYGVTAGAWVYWVRRRPDEGAYVAKGRIAWQEVRGRSDIVCAPRGGGSSRVVREGVVRGAALMCSGDTVFWMEPRAYPDRRADLLFSRDGGRPQVIRDYRGNPYGIPPAVMGGRLYWFACRAEPPYGRPHSQWSCDQLVSAAFDGTGRREVLQMDRLGRRAVLWGLSSNRLLVARRGCLLCLLGREEAAPSVSRGGYVGRYVGGYAPVYVSRIRPTDAAAVEDLYRLPERYSCAEVDGDDLYYEVVETHVGLDAAIARSRGDPSPDVSLPVLYRLRLADLID